MKISVIGAGVMGARITEVLIKGGHDVVMIDTNRDHATGSLNRIVADLAIGVEKQADQGRERRSSRPHHNL